MFKFLSSRIIGKSITSPSGHSLFSLISIRLILLGFWIFQFILFRYALDIILLTAPLSMMIVAFSSLIFPVQCRASIGICSSLLFSFSLLINNCSKNLFEEFLLCDTRSPSRSAFRSLKAVQYSRKLLVDYFDYYYYSVDYSYFYLDIYYFDCCFDYCFICYNYYSFD